MTNFVCPMCERASFDGKTHPGCKTRYSLDGLTSFYKYEGPIKAAVKRLKYKPYISDLVETLVTPIFNNAATLPTGRQVQQFNNDYVVVPVPLHPRRERQRGFNQAGLIGEELAKHLNILFNDKVLRRVKNIKPQVELKGKDRRENVKDAFSTAPNYTLDAKRYVLLVDDVWTTGSTLRSCANVLKRSGAKKVWAMTLAR